MAKNDSKELVEALFLAISEKDAGAVEGALNAGANPNSTSPARVPALLLATMTNDCLVMAALLDAGADPNVAGSGKSVAVHRTALSYACAFGMRSAITLLLQHGASPSLVSKDGKTPAHHLLAYGHSEETGTALWHRFAEKTLARMLDLGLPADARNNHNQSLMDVALESNAPIGIVLLLLEHGADPRSKRINGDEIIHTAFKAGRLDIARELIDRGVPIDATDKLGRSPLFYFDMPEVGASIIEIGANLDHQDRAGETALHNHVGRELRGNWVSPRVKLLVAAGARVDIKNKQGLTVLDLAKKMKLDAQIALLSAVSARQAMQRVGLPDRLTSKQVLR